MEGSASSGSNEVLPHVVLFKKPSEEYYESLKGLAASVTFAPVLRFERVEYGAKALLEILVAASEVNAVVTSPRAAEVLVDLASKYGMSGKVSCLSVGLATRNLLCKSGFKVLSDETAISAATLLPFVEKWASENPGKELVFLSGNIRKETIPEGLTALRIPFQEIVVYKSKQVEKIELPGRVSWKGVNTACFVFFSPSGVKFVAAQQDMQDIINTARIIGIGESTASAIRNCDELKTENVFVCSKPSPEGVAEVLRNMIRMDAVSQGNELPTTASS